ncbi:MAG TPA: pilin [Candidatus Magasanikbacteria bacterium]|nr:pilin [Candidatus Magasanikbacteria bacterium]
MLTLINKKQTNKWETVAKGGFILAAVLCFFVCLFSFNFVQAQPLDTGLAYAEQTGLPTTDIRLIIANIIRVALGLLGTIAVVIIIYGGWLWMSAGGNEDQIGKAKKTLINGTIGLIIILSAYSIVIFVMRMLGIGDYGGEIGDGQYAYQQQSIMNMSGSGAWGKAILDHYPIPNQTDVPRNTKIAITFAKPISFESVALETEDEGVFNLKKEVIKISGYIPSSTAVGKFDLIPHAGDFRIYSFTIETTTPSGVTTSEIFTIVIEPQNWLGDSNDEIRYLVRIEGTLLSKDGKSIFTVEMATE